MEKAFKPNRRGLKAMERDVQKELNKMRLTVPIRSDYRSGVAAPAVVPPPLPDDQDRVLKALFDLRAFVNDKGPEEIAERAGLDEAVARKAIQQLALEKLITGNGYGAGGHLTTAGKQYVIEQRSQGVRPDTQTTVNHFNGPTQYVAGDNASQTMTNTSAVDDQLLGELVEALRDLDTGRLTEAERDDLQADVVILTSQLESPTEVPGLRRALRTAKALAEKVTVGATAKLIVENADKISAALP